MEAILVQCYLFLMVVVMLILHDLTPHRGDSSFQKVGPSYKALLLIWGWDLWCEVGITDGWQGVGVTCDGFHTFLESKPYGHGCFDFAEGLEKIFDGCGKAFADCWFLTGIHMHHFFCVRFATREFVGYFWWGVWVPCKQLIFCTSVGLIYNEFDVSIEGGLWYLESGSESVLKVGPVNIIQGGACPIFFKEVIAHVNWDPQFGDAVVVGVCDSDVIDL